MELEDRKSIAIHVGSKFFRYVEKDGVQTPDIIRIISTDPIKDRIRYFDNDGKKKSITYEYLIENYKMLKADGMLIFTIVSVGAANDVMVALKDFARIGDPLPYAVCRQSIHDFFGEHNNKMSVGVSVSQDTCPANIDFRSVMICEPTKNPYTKSVLVYLDDTLEEILKFIRPTKFDNTLVSLKEEAKKELEAQRYVLDGNILGYCTTLKELLTMNNFMYDFRKCFNIMEVPFHIDSSRDTLNAENVLYLEKEFKANIMETYMIKYTKEIDLKTIKRDYCLITSAADQYKEVYIVGYDKADGDYVPRSQI